MHESEQEHELAAWEARLGAFRPGTSRLDRDRVMFLAGRASAQSGRARPPLGWVWPAALATIAAAAGGLLVVLLMQPPGNTSLPAPGRSEVVAREAPPVSVPDRGGARNIGDNRETLPVGPPPVFWPSAGEGETLTARAPRMNDADRAFAKIADGRLVESALEIAPPGSFGPPAWPGDPRRPRSYVEHRRMLLEELKCSGETSDDGAFRRRPTGV